MRELVGIFKAMGWRKVLQFHHDWNEAVIRQFYATLEVQAKNKKLIRMNGTRRFEATFQGSCYCCGTELQQDEEGQVSCGSPNVVSW